MENIHNDVKVQRVKDFNHMLYTLTSVGIFSIRFTVYFQWYWRIYLITVERFFLVSHQFS